jgi:sucrose phosphorylase
MTAAGGEKLLGQFLAAIERFAPPEPCTEAPDREGWDATDAILIAYGDQIHAPDKSPLACLAEWIDDCHGEELFNTLHILPFCPYSSDDGFSVIDYLQVDPQLGTWQDITALGRRVRLMFDLVLNHASIRSDWFARYVAGEEPYRRFFVEADPAADLSAVVRPRSLPLLTPVETTRGTRHVWTTFSADQVDLNYGEPLLLLRMVEILLEYLARGAQIVRLDAIAFLWKTPGTSCVHLPETHEVVKLFRDVVDAAAPQVWLLTETNVPHRENISYFGDADEARLVYQFPLPPLLLDAFVHGDATYLNRWLAALDPPAAGTTYVNFTASHDGIGVRPLEGLVPEGRVSDLVAAVKRRGGLVSTRALPDGDAPYELNITYVDALSPANLDPQLHSRRFLASQAVMLALQGIPAIYFHSLVGSRNDRAAADASGHARRINRRKFSRVELDHQLADPQSLSGQIAAGYRHLLAIRRQQPAFHPEAAQQWIEMRHPGVVAFLRTSGNEAQRILTLANVSSESVQLDTTPIGGGHLTRDLIAQEAVEPGSVTLEPGQARWLA